MSVAEAAQALGLSTSGYSKIERGERRLSGDFIRRAQEVFGVSSEKVIDAAGAGFDQEIDPNLLAEMIALTRERLGGLPKGEAKKMILDLISAARRRSQ